MHIITRKRLLDFVKKNPACKNGLEAWYRIIRHSKFNTIAELHKVFPSADQVGKFTVFNIGGNKVRLIVAFHYNTQRVNIRHVLTHAEYDRNKWKE
jgi:mRNA interferase HigB